MEFKDMSIEELEARLNTVPEELEKEDADLNAIEEEVRGIKAELEARKEAESKKVELRKMVASGAGDIIAETPAEEKKTMTIEEIRGSKEYAEAYKSYIINNDDTECRKLLSENVDGGYVPVPIIVDATVRTAWENNDILNRVNKTAFRGNFKAYFELSAGGAYEHVEGTSAPTEEALTLGVVENDSEKHQEVDHHF